jgi:integrase
MMSAPTKTAKPVKRARAKYQVRWWEGDKRPARYFDRKADRDNFVAALRRQQQMRGVGIADEDLTLGDFIETYWTVHAIPNLEAATRASYLQAWGKWIEPRLGGYELRVITPKVVNRFRLQMVKAGAGEPTIQRALAILGSILSLAVAEERIATNPVSAIRKPKQAAPAAIPAIAPLSIERLLARLGRRDAMLVELVAYQGLRPEEALALEPGAILEAGLRIRQKNVDGEIIPWTKTRRDRTVPWTGPVQQDLREFLIATGIRDGLLFVRPDGEPWRKHDYDNWRERVYQRQAARLDLAPRPYDLRGAWVSLLAWEGRSLLEVARWAGHSVQTCDRYYAAIFDDVDMAKRGSATEAIAKARDKVSRGEHTLFDVEALGR